MVSSAMQVKKNKKMAAVSAIDALQCVHYAPSTARPVCHTMMIMAVVPSIKAADFFILN